LTRPRIFTLASLRLSLLVAGLLWIAVNNHQCFAQVDLPAPGIRPNLSGLVPPGTNNTSPTDEYSADKSVESENIGEFCLPEIFASKDKASASDTTLDHPRKFTININSDQEPLSSLPAPPLYSDPAQQGTYVVKRFHVGRAILQSFYFTALMNAWRIAVEPSTRKDLKGPFWSDYVASVESLRGWRDGDEFYVNYVGHPMQGAVSGFIQIQNDERSTGLQIGKNPEYWKSRLRAMGWAALISCQFELGPFGEASIGNVGLKPSNKSPHPMAYVDLVITPTIGLAWILGEDLVDRYVLLRMESRVSNRWVRAFARIFLTPSRSFANLFRGEKLFYRENRKL